MREVLLCCFVALAACANLREDTAMHSIGTVSETSVSVPVSFEDNAASPQSSNEDAAAIGRRVLTTAFVQVGPDGFLTVELRNGQMLLLRDVIMRPNDYCGQINSGNASDMSYCGGYDEVVAASPGGRIDPT